MSKTLTKNNLLVFRDFIQKRTGLFFPESRFHAIEDILASHVRKAPYEDLNTYFFFLKSEKGADHLEHLISCLTTNETYFFRGKAHFDLLEKQILPKIIQREANTSKSIRIWSAGCSTGEEPYSIAILLKTLIPNIDEWHIQVVATDIDEAALKKARAGGYGQWSFRGLDSDLVMHAFTKKQDLYYINAAYKPLVSFHRNNLISDPLPQTDSSPVSFDIIFCRNVTIYFEQETIKTLASKFHAALKEGGYLIVGDAEHSAENYALFKSRTFPGAILYQKKRAEGSDFGVDMPLYQSPAFSKKTSNPGSSLKVKNGRHKAVEEENGRLLQFIRQNKKKCKTMKDSASLPIQDFEEETTSLEEGHIFHEAMQYYFEKRDEMAIDRFLRIVDMHPENKYASWMLSHIASNRGDFDEAVAWSERCIKIDALFKEPYYTLATIYMAKGHLNLAMAQIKKALYIDPDFILGHFVMGSLYRLMQVPAEAEKCFQRMQGFISSKATDEVIFETEFLAVGMLSQFLEHGGGQP